MRSGNIENYLDYSFEHPTKKIIFDTKNILYFILNLKEGQSIPKHQHEHSSLLLTVITGEGKITVGKEIAELRKGDCILIDGGDDFSIAEVTGHLSVSVVVSPRPVDEKYASET